MPDQLIAQPKGTIYYFYDHAFNISLLERLIAHGAIELSLHEWPLQDVIRAARLHTYSFDISENGKWKMEQSEAGGAVNVKLDHALSLSQDNKTMPVFVAEMPETVSDEVSQFVLIDGLHRTVRHILDDTETIKVLLISRPEDLCRFHYQKVDGKAIDAFGNPVIADRLEVKYYWAAR